MKAEELEALVEQLRAIDVPTAEMRVLWVQSRCSQAADALTELIRERDAMRAVPIPMILHCPKCHLQHIDEPDERTPDWDNPPHRSHLCHGCGCIWRPADVPTNGVGKITTIGKSDTWPPAKP